MSHERLNLPAQDGGQRLDRFLAAQVPEHSRATLQRLIDAGQVLVNQRSTKASYRLRAGDQVTIDLPRPREAELTAEPIPLRIVLEDDALLIVDKPPGMVVHPAPGHATGTLVNALLAHCPELGRAGGDRPGIVHRLDRDTSGLIIVAKSDPVRRALQRQFQAHAVEKHYLALLDGRLQPPRGRIHAPLARDPRHRQRISVQAGGREASTEYRVVELYAHATGPAQGEYSLVLATPETGRTHQIRVHFASIGHPVVGDAVYGRRRTTLPLARHFLHAWRLSFQHPLSGQPIACEAPLPEDLAAVLTMLRGG